MSERCWRSECRFSCYYPDVCSERKRTTDRHETRRQSERESERESADE